MVPVVPPADPAGKVSPPIVPPAVVQPPLVPANASVLKWTGEVPQQKWMNFYTKVLSKFASARGLKLTVTVEGKTATYDGVPLTQLLARVGAPAGQALRGAALRDTVLVTGHDGFVAVLALAETDPGFRKEQILLADRADGQPLAEGVGPYRLVVEGDLRAARAVRMVTAIQVKAAQ